MEKSLHNLCSINHFQKFGAGENDGKEFEIVVGDIFCPFPRTFGSRGDRYLWGKLASYFSMEKIYAEFNAELALERAFEHLLDVRFSRAPEEFFNEGLAHGGMSSGVVSMQWWKSTGLRLLNNRIEAIRAALPVDLFEISET